MTALAFDRHNHDRCIAGALKRAETHCGARRLQFTATRRRVLEILLQEHRAMGAYDILAVLSSEGLGSQPPAAYRALDFLVEHGLAHRIQRLNAFAGSGTNASNPFATRMLGDDSERPSMTIASSMARFGSGQGANP